jgi:hypothetical protein
MSIMSSLDSVIQNLPINTAIANARFCVPPFDDEYGYLRYAPAHSLCALNKLSLYLYEAFGEYYV